MKESEVRSQNSRSQVTGVRGHDQLSAISPQLSAFFRQKPKLLRCGLRSAAEEPPGQLGALHSLRLRLFF
jgi:hypothetical protein